MSQQTKRQVFFKLQAATKTWETVWRACRSCLSTQQHPELCVHPAALAAVHERTDRSGNTAALLLRSRGSQLSQCLLTCEIPHLRAGVCPAGSPGCTNGFGLSFICSERPQHLHPTSLRPTCSQICSLHCSPPESPWQKISWWGEKGEGGERIEIHSIDRSISTTHNSRTKAAMNPAVGEELFFYFYFYLFPSKKLTRNKLLFQQANTQCIYFWHT